jgi:hypothetical protein
VEEREKYLKTAKCAISGVSQTLVMSVCLVMYQQHSPASVRRMHNLWIAARWKMWTSLSSIDTPTQEAACSIKDCFGALDWLAYLERDECSDVQTRLRGHKPYVLHGKMTLHGAVVQCTGHQGWQHLYKMDIARSN